MRWCRTFGIPLVTSSFLLFALFLVPTAASANGLEAVNTFIKGVVWSIVSTFFGFLVWTGGGFLDYAVQEFIIEFGQGFQNKGFGFAVNNLWMVVRDLFNLTFIFALVYIGFKLILGGDDSGAKRAIVNLVIAALLVNFSLFFTKVIIDFTNITATQVANVIYNGQPPGTTGSISSTFMNQMSLTTTLGPSTASPQVNTISWTYIFGAMVLYLIAAFAFIAGAVLLTIRFIALNFFMILSPMMFIGRVLPFMESQQKNFWKSFLNNAFFAPIFLLLIYFSLYILEQMRQTRTGGSLHDVLNGAGESPLVDVNTIAFFLLTGGFLIGSVLIAQKMSVIGGGAAVSVGQNLRARGQRLVGSMTLGTGAAIGQRTIGRAASRIADTDKMKDWAAKSFIGAAAFKATNKLGDASFDGRHALNAMGVKALGKGTKGGYETRLKEAKEADKKFAESLGEQKLADTKTQKGRDEREAQTKGYREAIERDITEGTAGRELSDARTAATSALNALQSAEQNLANSQAGERQNVTFFEQQLANTTDTNRRNELQSKIRESNEKIANLARAAEADLKAKRAASEKAAKLQEAAQKKVQSQAEAQFTYARQLKLIERRRKEAARYSISTTGKVATGVLSGSGAAALAIGGVVTNTGIGTAGYAAASIVGSYADSYAAAADELEKIYGKDGTKKAQNKRDDEERKKLAKLLKEENKEEKKDDDKEDKD